jgi:hypothetical protein
VPLPISATPETAFTGGSFCLASIDVVHMTTGLAPASAIIDPELPAGDPYASETFIDSTYRSVGSSLECAPGATPVSTPPLEVISYASGSTAARAWRAAYQRAGDAIRLDALDPDWSRSGVTTVTIGATPTTAYVLATDDTRSSALLDVGGTTVLLSGPFDRTTLEPVVSQLIQQ